ncbi:ribosome maturation factor RimP [Gordonia soli]|uniref:Ribosome maturation factor RimP n=1 Tax=Gordonia soli NBRC 108243 TaxID=1223545 RepID=M0QKH5_9ACTN|nr:ribosome maturation factor RimP [Gordonia soli]GAC68939.1 ribosome maturation factor RimP [Gordonia soli NBRC 108243]
MPIGSEQVSDLVAPVVEARGFDLEDVVLSGTGERRDVTVVVDRDGGGDLDVLADLSREISEVLDADDALGEEPYTLEVTSPGIDRPLTRARHWRRAQGRRVAIDLVDDGARQIVGRVGQVDDGQVRVVIADKGRISERDIALDTIATAVVQIEFGRPGAAELERCGLDADEIARRRESAQ